MLFRLSIYILCAVVISWACYEIGISFTLTAYKDYLSALLTASSMVFTLMGIWIAFLYPNALQRLASPNIIENADFSESLRETKRLESLVASVLKSAVVVMMIMGIYLLNAILPSFEFYSLYLLHIKAAALGLAIMLGVIQVQSIFYVVYSNVMFINDLHSKREDREADADI